MGDYSKLLKMKSEGEDWCPNERKLELRLGPPGEESNCFTAKVASAPVVGWPPIRSFRKNMSHGTSYKTKTETLTGLAKLELATIQNPKSGLYVKINMEGVPIGRKIDLTAFTSYEKLSGAIDDLFRDLLAAQRLEEKPAAGKPVYYNNHREEYTLVYEDNEGDRMLVGDVPWHMFVNAATRLRVMKTSELRTLSVRYRKQ